MKYRKERMLYTIVFLFLFVAEVLIALFVHDGFIRPYVGDVLIVILIYCFLRVLFPVGLPLLALYVFLFASAVEILQYFDFVSWFGLGENAFARILLGTTFSFVDILCYLIGCLLCMVSEHIRRT